MHAIRRDCPGEPKLAAYGFLEKSTVYYAGHPLPFCSDADELHDLIGDSLTYVFTDDKCSAECSRNCPASLKS